MLPSVMPHLSVSSTINYLLIFLAGLFQVYFLKVIWYNHYVNGFHDADYVDVANNIKTTHIMQDMGKTTSNVYPFWKL